MKLKRYKNFILENLEYDNRFKFEEKVIDPILNVIKDNQEYLTQTENLPELAKLGFMFETLWSAGRVCWGYDGILLDKSLKKSEDDDDDDDDDDGEGYYSYISCEDNPKYKLEEVSDIGDIDDRIYDAWGMHVSNSGRMIDFDGFKKLIYEGKELTPLEKKSLKLNKTFDEWVDILTDDNYKYKSIYPNRRSVANHLLCTRYSLSKEGFIYQKASGADQDIDLYGNWENAKFKPQIKTVIDRIMSIKELKMTLNSTYNYFSDIHKKEIEKELKSWISFIPKDTNPDQFKTKNDLMDFVYKELDKSDTFKSASKSRHEDNDNKYTPYYPISKSSSTIWLICDKESQNREGIRKIDQSYIEASIEICRDIIENEEGKKPSSDFDSMGRNLEIAKEILGKLGVDGYKDKSPEFNKYELFEDLKDLLTSFTDEFNGYEITGSEQSVGNCYSFHLDDTARSSYGTNNYNLYVNFEKGNTLPKGCSKSIEFLKSAPFYHGLKNFWDSLNTLSKSTYPEIKHVSFGYDNIPDYSAQLSIKIITNKESLAGIKRGEEIDKKLINDGFEVGSRYMMLPIADMIFYARKFIGHSNSLSLEVCDKNFKKLASFEVDERGFNTIRYKHANSPADLVDWVLSQHEEMKKSKPEYGYGEREGKERLYVQDFMLWLKNHKNEL